MDGVPKLHRSELLLIGVVVGIGLLGLMTWLVFFNRDSGKRVPVDKLSATWTLTPNWTKPPELHSFKDGAGGELAIFVDCSEPMGGFLPPGDAASESSSLASLIRLAPQQLASIDSGKRSEPVWYSIEDTVDMIPVAVSNTQARSNKSTAKQAHCVAPKDTRGFYNGSDSRIDRAAEDIFKRLEAGKIEAAVVITDLVATGRLIGAQGMAQAMRERISSSVVRDGELAFGLVGVKARYWGVRGGQRLSEERGIWLALPPGVSKAPLYALVFARSPEAAKKVLNGLSTELSGLGFEEVQSELLTEASAISTPEMEDCTVLPLDSDKKRQFALFPAGEKLRCARSETILLTCPLPASLKNIEPVSGANLNSLTIEQAQGALQVELDCKEQRKHGSSFDLELELRGDSTEIVEEAWEDWSSVTDDRDEDIGKTLNLKLFFERVRLRPDAYGVKVRLRPAGGGNVE